MVGRIEDVGLDRQIAVHEFRRLGTVGKDSTHLGRGQEYVLWPLGREKTPDSLLATEIQLLAGADNEVVVAVLAQPPANRRTHQAAMAGDENPGRLIHSFPSARPAGPLQAAGTSYRGGCARGPGLWLRRSCDTCGASARPAATLARRTRHAQLRFPCLSPLTGRLRPATQSRQRGRRRGHPPTAASAARLRCAARAHSPASGSA